MFLFSHGHITLLNNDLSAPHVRPVSGGFVLYASLGLMSCREAVLTLQGHNHGLELPANGQSGGEYFVLEFTNPCASYWKREDTT